MADAYTGQDTIQVEDFMGEFTLSDFADGTVAELAANNELATVTTGYNGNGLGAHNEPGRQRVLTLRLVKASGDDKRFNENFELWKKRDMRFKPLKCNFTKNITHQDGSVTHDTVECYFGLPTGVPSVSNDTTGNVEQVVSVYTITFADYKRLV